MVATVSANNTKYANASDVPIMNMLIGVAHFLLNSKIKATKMTGVRKQQLRKHLIIEMCICLHQLCNLAPVKSCLFIKNAVGCF